MSVVSSSSLRPSLLPCSGWSDIFVLLFILSYVFYNQTSLFRSIIASNHHLDFCLFMIHGCAGVGPRL